MAIKFQAKDTDELEEELEEWSIGMNLFSTVAPADSVITIDKDDVKEDKSKRSTYKNKDVMDINI